MSRDKEEMTRIAEAEKHKLEFIIIKKSIDVEIMPLFAKMRKNAQRLTEALGWPKEDMPIVMAVLYRDQLPQQLLDEVNELAETEQEEELEEDDTPEAEENPGS